MTTPQALSSATFHSASYPASPCSSIDDLVCPPTAPSLVAQRGTVPLPDDWALERGGSLVADGIDFELVGPVGAPLVVVLGGISAHAHVTASPGRPQPGWWEAMVGPGRAIDTRRFRVLSFDFLTPRGQDPLTLPAITTVDQARALELILTKLSLPRLHAFVGASYGGMVALAFAAHFARRLERVIVISAAERSHPRSTAWRVVQRRIVRQACARGETRRGLALARALAMVTYRSAAELERRFDGAPEDVAGELRFPIEAYLDARGESFAEKFDAATFLCLSESIDLHRIDPERITVPTTLIAVQSDELVGVEQMRALAGRLSGARLIELDSLYGHDAFLKETDQLGEVLARCLRSEEGV